MAVDRGAHPSDPIHSLTGFRLGDVLLGKYRIDRLLGVGGMGAVLAATHLQLEDRVAIKVLLPDVLDLPDAVSRFEQEARAAARIKSEHVVRVVDVGQLPGDVPYMVMEYLEGEDLADLLKRRGALALTEALDLLDQACQAVAAAHAQGVVHRDLKPSNLFIAEDAEGGVSLKVLDFGISKVMRRRSSELDITQASSTMGTPNYMSPEQMSSARDVDVRADIWSLGVIAYELLTGTLPFVADEIPAVCSLVLTEPAPPLRSKRPELPAALEAVVTRCLEKHRERRFSDARELRAALQAAAQPGATTFTRVATPTRVAMRTPTSAPPLVPAPGPSSVPAPEAASSTQPDAAAASRRWLIPAAAALWLIVLAFVVQLCSRPSAVSPLAQPLLTAAAPPAQVAARHADDGVVTVDALPLEKPDDGPHRVHGAVAAPQVLAPTSLPAVSPLGPAAAKARTPEELLRDRK